MGISGWRYAPWRKVFYPAGLPQRRELEFASRKFDSVELNGSFYSLQRPESYQRWHDETPDDFVFTVKGPRYITHMLRLRDSRTALANFFASGVLALGDKLGPILWQLPERHAFDEEQLERFFALLPRSTTAAADLATEHDAKVDGRTHLVARAEHPLRHALEVRSASFVDDRFYDVLRRHDIGLVVADTANRWPLLTEVTSDFVYVRLHGAEELYVSGYSEELLAQWAERIAGWTSGETCPDGLGRDVYVYFDNDAKVHAPFDAIALRALVDAATAS
ncbi:DUF72 domain-containing protein [Cryobacterium tepidiphilum]|uniref:DUF72 domain-containing protein n=1 Tax=Cryobacterium tepidiphilum TaxID=2486026 RepID=A0A3M8LM69_9MICO|nr:DUF72 domain-containing protein [Cryobacterium tepidiphilum]